MDKEKEIEEMVKIIRENASKCLQDGYVCTIDDDVVALYNAGYGNIEQAVREFAGNIIELLDENIARRIFMGMEHSNEYNDGYDDGVADCITNIKSRLTELYGADE